MAVVVAVSCCHGDTSLYSNRTCPVPTISSCPPHLLSFLKIQLMSQIMKCGTWPTKLIKVSQKTKSAICLLSVCLLICQFFGFSVNRFELYWNSVFFEVVVIMKPDNLHHLYLHLRVPETCMATLGQVFGGEECFLIYLYQLTKGTPLTEMARSYLGWSSPSLGDEYFIHWLFFVQFILQQDFWLKH